MRRDYRNILAWQRADAFACEVYAATRHFPAEELYNGLGNSLRMAAVSAATRIVEGSAGCREEELIRALREAQISLAAADYYLVLSRQLEYIGELCYMQLEELRSDASALLSCLVITLEEHGEGEQADRVREVAGVS